MYSGFARFIDIERTELPQLKVEPPNPPSAASIPRRDNIEAGARKIRDRVEVAQRYAVIFGGGEHRVEQPLG